MLAWGYGELGDGTSDYRITPVDLMDYITLGTGESIIQIQAGDSYVIALSSDARVFTWGYNSAGQLGDGTTTKRLSPVEITASFVNEVGEDPTMLFLGYTASSSFVMTNYANQIYAFGYNGYGLLGDFTTTSRTAPVPINLTAFSYLDTSQFDYQDAIVLIADPDKSGSTFAGWYTDPALTQAFTLTNMPSNHIKLYAKWS